MPHAVQFLQKLTLPFGELGRRLYTNFDEQVALAPAIQHRYAFILDTETGSRLRALGNFQRVFALERRDFDFSSQSGLRERNRNHTVQIIPFPLEERMLLNMEHNVKVAGRAAEVASFAQAAIADASSVFDPSRNLGLNLSFFQDPALAPALRTRIRDYAAGTLTRSAGAGDAEETLLVANLAATTAATACNGSFAGSSA